MPRGLFDPSTDYYGLLAVCPSASSEEILASYRRMAKQYHPDLNSGSKVAAARMARMNVAKHVLLHPPTRAAYDTARGQRHAPPTPDPTDVPVHRVRVVTAHASRAIPRRKSSVVDRSTVLLIALALPLVAALAAYLVDGIQVAARPVAAAPSDLMLAQAAHPTTRGIALEAFAIVGGQPPSRGAGTAANRQIQSLIDPSPEGEMLRDIGRQLVASGANGDRDAWTQAVSELCVLAERC